MNEAQAEHREWQSVRAVSRALVPDERLRNPRLLADHAHMLDRISASAVAINDAIEAFAATPDRSAALSLVLVTDFCWQVLRALGGKGGDDRRWIEAALPPDHEASDAEVGDTHFARQIEIVVDAQWVFALHTALRHPGSALADHVWLLREPPPSEHQARLLRAARGVVAVLRNTAARAT
jgi:hypothetical protein